MKKIILILATVFLIVALLSSCTQTQDNGEGIGSTNGNHQSDGDDNTVKEGIKIDPDGDIELDVGKTREMRVINLSTGMETSNIFWSSQDESIVTINGDGVLTGVTQGNTTVTATTIDGEYSVSCNVKVTLRLSGVELSYEEYDLEVGDSIQLEAFPLPSDFEGATYTWMSSVPSVASVDDSGLVTARKLGNTSIMVEANPGGYTAICSINVGKNAESITIDFEELTVNRGLSMSLGFEMYPADATSRPHWKSSDEKVAIVNSSGTITALSCGEAVITVSTTNGLSASAKITVISALEGIDIVDEEIAAKKNSQITPDVNFFPSDATTKELIWTSSDTNIVKVTSDGQLIAVANGRVTLTAVSVDGSYKDSCVAVVTNPLSSIKFDGVLDKDTGKYPTVSIPYGSSVKIQPIIDPIDADEIPLLVWTSSDPSVLSVAADGTLTALARGNATVTLGLPDGMSASFDVEVTKPVYNVDRIETDSAVYYMKPGGGLSVGIRYFPELSEEDAEFYSIVSNDESIVTYDKESGIITAHLTGECEITVTVISADNKLVRTSAKIIVVDDTSSFDEQYKNDIHALRDGTLAGDIKTAEKRLDEIKAELSDIRNDLAAEQEKETPDADLVAHYNSEIIRLENESEQLSQTLAEKKKEYAAAEKGIAAKYSSVMEDLSYDPEQDPYPQEISDSDFVKISDYINDAVIDLRYSGEKNEIGKEIYNFSDAYLRYGTVKKLITVAEQLKYYGWKLVVWDAYRPTSAQDRIWSELLVTDIEYSAESHGNSISVSVVKENGEALEMPSDFGDNTEKSDRDYSDVSENAEGNALLLETVMTASGFEIGEKWWNYVDTDQYPLETEFLN